MPHAPLRPVLLLLAFLAGLAGATSPLAAQCQSVWLPGEGSPGTDLPASSAVTWDPDGAGPATPVLVVGGAFSIAGNVAAARVARWDPATGSWAPLGAGVSGDVRALAVLANGDLVAAVNSQVANPGNRIERWTGTQWLPLGGTFDGYVQCVVGMPNGDVVAGGSFQHADGVPANSLARWNGGAWSGFGSGITGTVRSLLVRGSGDLVVGGTFGAVDGVPANCIASWNGSTWSSFGVGMNPFGSDGVYAMAELANGQLVAGGLFPNAGGSPVNNIARWDGSSWFALLGGLTANAFLNGCVRSMLPLPNGDLIVGGVFPTASGLTVRSISRWNGIGWNTLGVGFQQLSIGVNAEVAGLARLPSGDVVAAGNFRSGGGQYGDGVSRWDGSAWRALGSGFNNQVQCIGVGTGGQFVVGGTFTMAGGGGANRVARWTGSSWHALGTGANGTVNAAVVMPNGDVVIGGSFTAVGGVAANHIARWNGSSWSALASGMNSTVNSLAVDATGALIAGGNFTTAGGTAANRLARWTGFFWLPVGGGLSGSVTDLHVRPNGDLVVAGSFSTAGTVPVNNLALWNGSSWSALGGMISPTSLTTMANGDLVAGYSGGVARWDGTAWVVLGSGSSSWVWDVAALPNGELIAIGDFTTIGGVQAERIARWNGSSWAPLGSGFDNRPLTTALLPHGELLVGGMFTWAGGQPSPYLARFGTTCPASSVQYGPGCPSSGGGNALAPVVLPWTGGTFRARATGLPTVAVVAGVTGFSATSLPLAAVLPQGQPGCTLLASPDVLDLVVAAAGAAEIAVAVPASPALAGRSFWHQHVPFEFDLGGNLVAATATNTLRLTIGSW